MNKYDYFIEVWRHKDDNKNGVRLTANPIPYKLISYYLNATLSHYPTLRTIAIFKIKLK